MKRNKLAKIAAVTAAAMLAFSDITVYAQDIEYTTQRGDNLSKIAQKMYGDKARWRDIYDANRELIKDPNKIWANQQFVIPDVLLTENEQPGQAFWPDIQTPATWPERTAEWQAAAASAKSYVEQNGIAFNQGPDYVTTGYNYIKDAVEWFHFIPVSGRVDSITVRDSDKEGYQVVTISEQTNGYFQEYYDGTYYNYMSFPNMVICDLYTGKQLPSAATDGDVELVNTAQLEWNGIQYSIDYVFSVEWEHGEWQNNDEESFAYKPTTAHRTYIITIPKGYDGLAVQVNPHTEGPSADNADNEYNVFDNETEKYILDAWEEGSVLMRVSDLYNILNNK